MKRYLARFLIAFGFGGLMVALSLQTSVAVGPHVAVLSIDGAIDPISAGFLEAQSPRSGMRLRVRPSI